MLSQAILELIYAYAIILFGCQYAMVEHDKDLSLKKASMELYALYFSNIPLPLGIGIFMFLAVFSRHRGTQVVAKAMSISPKIISFYFS